MLSADVAEDIYERNMKFEYIRNFEKLGFGLFVHFGLYSILGKGEWYYTLNPEFNVKKYNALIQKFNPKKKWAIELVNGAKKFGCKYIVLTVRHHDGFSLYDTCGLSMFDSMHSVCKRDLVAEFVEACRNENIIPFFYHTLLDWSVTEYENNFTKYIDYLAASLEILCTNYGKVGGFWFDGMWNKPDENWQEDRLYGIIRKYQPDAMIINNTGLSELGKVGHYEIDSVTFERGAPVFVDNSDKYRAGEMCQVLNDHWGYAKNDCNYKSVNELIENLIDCRRCGCNFLLNTGLKGSGKINNIDACLMKEIGKWIEINKKFIYEVKPGDFTVENAEVLKGEKYYYIAIKKAGMSADVNVQREVAQKIIRFPAEKKICSARWLDNGAEILHDGSSFSAEPFPYGTSLCIRIAQVEIENNS